MRVYYVGLQRVERPFTCRPCFVPGDAAWWSIIALLGGFAITTAASSSSTSSASGHAGRSSGFSSGSSTPAMAAAVGDDVLLVRLSIEISLRDAIVLASAIPALGWILLGAASRVTPAPRARKTARRSAFASACAPSSRRWPAVPSSAGASGISARSEHGFGPGEQLRALYAVFGVRSCSTRAAADDGLRRRRQQRAGRCGAGMVEPVRRVARCIAASVVDGGRRPRVSIWRT